MEEQEAQEVQEERREPLLTRSTIGIILAFVVINITVILAIFGGQLFGGPAEGEGSTSGGSVLEDTSLISLGRIEVSVPLNPLQQTFMRCSASISLQVDADRLQKIEPMITRNDAIFKELAREAFRNASPEDIATENLAGVKNAIKRGVNELLGEEAVKEIYFKDYRPY